MQMAPVPFIEISMLEGWVFDSSGCLSSAHEVKICFIST